MEGYEALIASIALTCGASWASGINLYAVVVVLGLAGSTGDINLPEGLQVLSNPLVLVAAGAMYCVEFFADKIPGIDTGWDTLHTFIRIPAGAMLAAQSLGDVTPAFEIAAGLLGGSLAATSHATKTGSRLLINTSPEPITNWGASIAEDVVVVAGLWAALNHPLLFLALLIIALGLSIWLLPKLWRLLKTIVQKIGCWLGLAQPSPDETSRPSDNQHSTLGTVSPTLLDALERLQALKESGALTEAEFIQQKQLLLSEPNS